MVKLWNNKNFYKGNIVLTKGCVNYGNVKVTII